jgi:hypothetical protein
MSDRVYCKPCGVYDDEQAECHGCGEMFPHDQLVHYDDVGAFCEACEMEDGTEDPNSFTIWVEKDDEEV